MTEGNDVLLYVGYLFTGGTIPKEFFNSIITNNLVVEEIYVTNWGDDVVALISGSSSEFIEIALINFNKEKVEYDENC